MLKTEITVVDGVASAAYCQFLCFRDAICQVFNFFPGQYKCVLGDEDKARCAAKTCRGLTRFLLIMGALSLSHRVPSPDAVSGPKLCDTCPCTDPNVKL